MHTHIHACKYFSVSSLYASAREYIISIMFTDFMLTRISCLRNKVNQ